MKTLTVAVLIVVVVSFAGQAFACGLLGKGGKTKAAGTNLASEFSLIDTPAAPAAQ